MSKKRKVVPEWRAEGQKLEAARLRMLEKDRKFTQSYVASLVGQEQGIWFQWNTGTTRILDGYWLTFAKHLDFDPFESRPELLDLGMAIEEAASRAGKGGARTAPAAKRTVPPTIREVADSLKQMPERGFLELAHAIMPKLNRDDRIELARLALADLSK